jgi:cytochrome b
MLLLHIAAVIVTDKREGGAIISAMFTGKKYLSGRPQDATDPE